VAKLISDKIDLFLFHCNLFNLKIKTETKKQNKNQFPMKNKHFGWLSSFLIPVGCSQTNQMSKNQF
jgi:hypothetical protein